MKNIGKSVLVINAIIVLLLIASINADTGGGKLKLGYLYTDEVGNLEVNQETFNTYEGAVFSLLDMVYLFDGGLSINADMQNITLNNRNLTASISKPGLFSISAHNNQYRRNYEFNGGNFTRRRTTSFNGTFKPFSYAQLFAGFGVTAKKGVSNDLIAETYDTVNVDYSHTTFNFGANMLYKKNSLFWEYRHLDFSNNVESELYNTGRTADAFRLSGSTLIPKYDWILVSGGYHYRLDKIESNSTELKTNLGWGAAKLYIPQRYIINYRISYARTNHSATLRETDNVINTISIGKSWAGKFGLRIGYENRVADDLTDRTESNGLLLNGWLKIKKQLLVRVFTSTRENNVVNGTTLIGEESIARHKITAIYTPSSRVSLRVQWNGQFASHDPDTQIRDTLTDTEVGSKVDYNTLTASLKLSAPDYGKIIVSHTYYRGQFENNSADLSYEFSDHLFRASIYPNSYKNLSVFASGKYYRSRRNRDVEKTSISINAEYVLKDTYTIGAQYEAYNFDNFLVFKEYYTTNIVHFYVIKNFEI